MSFLSTALSPENREDALRQMSETRVRCAGHRWWGGGGRSRARRCQPRPDRRAGRGPRPGIRHIQPVLETGARRPALSQAAQFLAGLRGAARTQADPRRRCVRTWRVRSSSSTRWRRSPGTGPTSAPASASTTFSAPGAVYPATSGISRSPRPCKSFRARQDRRHQGRHHVLRGPARRRPSHHDDLPDRRLVRRLWSPRARGSPASCATASGSSAPRSRISRPAARSRSRLKHDGQCGRRLDRRDPADDRAGKGQFRVTASKGVHVIIPRDRIDSDTGLITETEKSLLFIIPCPWSDDFWVIGTTDTPWTLDLAHPAASRSATSTTSSTTPIACWRSR